MNDVPLGTLEKPKENVGEKKRPPHTKVTYGHNVKETNH